MICCVSQNNVLLCKETILKSDFTLKQTKYTMHFLYPCLTKYQSFDPAIKYLEVKFKRGLHNV